MVGGWSSSGAVIVVERLGLSTDYPQACRARPTIQSTIIHDDRECDTRGDAATMGRRANGNVETIR